MVCDSPPLSAAADEKEKQSGYTKARNYVKRWEDLTRLGVGQGAKLRGEGWEAKKGSRNGSIREGIREGDGRVVFAWRLIRRETLTPPSSRALNYRATKQDFEVGPR